MLDDLDVRVDLGDRFGCRLDLGPIDVGLAVDDLALQIGLVDDVIIDDSERADTGRGEVEQRGTAEPAGADDEHLGVLESLLTDHPDVGNDEVAAVATDLIDREFVCGFHEGGNHGVLLFDAGVGITPHPPSIVPLGSNACSARPDREQPPTRLMT